MWILGLKGLKRFPELTVHSSYLQRTRRRSLFFLFSPFVLTGKTEYLRNQSDKKNEYSSRHCIIAGKVRSEGQRLKFCSQVRRLLELAAL